MKKYVLIQNGKDEPVGKYKSKAEAADVMGQIIGENNDDLNSDDENYLTAFDFRLEKEAQEINTFEQALDFLCEECAPGTDVKHEKALSALEMLFVISQAWNKGDGFVPDFSNENQYKYFPWFEYNKDTAGFVCTSTGWTVAPATAAVGSRLCFATRERAFDFGKKFESLYNDFLLLDK